MSIVVEEKLSGTNVAVNKDTPFSLREFGEIPKDHVPVFIMVDKESIDHIANNGFRTQDNLGMTREQQLEEIFMNSAKEHNIAKFDITKCVFAYPRHPSLIRCGLTYDADKHEIIEAYVDPKTALVTNGEYFTEASVRLKTYGSIESARSWADDYWESSKPLADYLQEGHKGQEYDFDDFTFPEVLIMEDIPTSRLKVRLDNPNQEENNEGELEAIKQE